MQLPLMALQTEPFRWASFSPLFVAIALWIGFVGYGLFVLRNHPRGLRPLFFTEMWERFSYYGMRALLMFYMLLPVSEGGIGLNVKVAAPIYGFYTFLVYALSVPGGWIADRFLGYRKSVVVGAVLIALGEFGIATGNPALFYAGLLTIAAGTGLLKTNCTSMVGMLYGDDRERQDAGYTIYYMGINIGALIAPLILGFMAQDAHFTAALHRAGLGSANGWHWAFGFAGLAMLAGLAQYLLQQKQLGDAGLKLGSEVSEQGHQQAHEPLTHEEKQRMWVIALLCLFIMTFFFVFEQAGTTLNLFADEHTHNAIGSWAYPSAWYQSVNSIWLLILAPIVSWIWVSLGKKDPSSPVKFTLGLVFVGLGMLLLVAPSRAFEANTALKVSPNWLMGVYCFHTIGELCLSPVGLSTTSKLAPARYAGLMMGVFFFALGMGNFLAGLAAAVPLKSSTFFLVQFGITTVMALVLVALTPKIKRMMGETN